MNDLVRLRSCLETIRSAVIDVQAFTTGLEETDLVALPEVDRRTYRALSGALIEVSELASTLPIELRARHPGVDWRGWIGLRELLLTDGLRGEMRRVGPCIEHDLSSLLITINVEIVRLEA